MLDPDYKAEKEASVSGLTGSSVSHVLRISSVAVTSVALYSALYRYTSRKPSNHVAQWTLLVLPLLLAMTSSSSYPGTLALALLAPCIVITALFGREATTNEAMSIPSAPPPSKVPERKTTTIPQLPALTTYRAHMMLMTVLAILAVDFPVFDRSLAKCETFGVSLMDIGVGSFVFSQGLVSAIPIVKDPSYLASPLLSKVYRTAKKCLPLLVLGVARVIAVKASGYPEHETEYGRHWNFFFTMSLVPVVQSLFHPLILRVPIGVLACTVAVAQQAALYYGLQGFALNAPRENLVSANKEGLVSLPGYVAIDLLGLLTGTIILPPVPDQFQKQLKAVLKSRLTKRSRKDSNEGRERHVVSPNYRENDRTFVKLASYSAIWWFLFGLCYFVELGGGVSRQLTNLSYILWTAAYNTLFIASYYVVDIFFFSYQNTTRYSSVSHLKVQAKADTFPSTTLEGSSAMLFQAINKNSLSVFLLANVATGLVNMNVQTMRVHDTQAMMILCAYSFTICAFAWYFRDRRLPLL
ncbi:GWT1-domain-containing protein, partial [Flagelloscypha sp. PMI_526]